MSDLPEEVVTAAKSCVFKMDLDGRGDEAMMINYVARAIHEYAESYTYWKGAYERMAARNIELERQLAELRK